MAQLGRKQGLEAVFNTLPRPGVSPGCCQSSAEEGIGKKWISVGGRYRRAVRDHRRPPLPPVRHMAGWIKGETKAVGTASQHYDRKTGTGLAVSFMIDKQPAGPSVKVLKGTITGKRRR